MYIFSVDYNIIDNSNIVIIDKYLNDTAGRTATKNAQLRPDLVVAISS